MTMQNFRINITENLYELIYEGAVVGAIEYNSTDDLWTGYPSGRPYSAVFLSLEEAVVELMFHIYKKKFDKICMC